VGLASRPVEAFFSNLLGEILHHEGDIFLRVFDTCLWTRMREFDGRTRSPGGDRGRSDSGQDAKKMAAISHDQD